MKAELKIERSGASCYSLSIYVTDIKGDILFNQPVPYAQCLSLDVASQAKEVLDKHGVKELLSIFWKESSKDYDSIAEREASLEKAFREFLERS